MSAARATERRRSWNAHANDSLAAPELLEPMRAPNSQITGGGFRDFAQVTNTGPEVVASTVIDKPHAPTLTASARRCRRGSPDLIRHGHPGYRDEVPLLIVEVLGLNEEMFVRKGGWPIGPGTAAHRADARSSSSAPRREREKPSKGDTGRRVGRGELVGAHRVA
jgi:hypothetical protein